MYVAFLNWALSWLNSAREHNTEPDLIFSPNEHYLSSLIEKMVAADSLSFLSSRQIKKIHGYPFL